MASKFLGVLDYFVSRLFGARVISRQRYALLASIEESRERDFEDAIDLESIRTGRAEITAHGAVDWQQLKAETL